jgi:hypothetical protein
LLRQLPFCIVLATALTAAACDNPYAGRGELHARKVALQRQVEGLRDTVARLERNESVLPPDDVAVAVDDTVIRDIIAAQLPFDEDIDRYHIRLTSAEVTFQESQVVRLRGSIYRRDRPDLTAEVTVAGALDKIRIDEITSTLKARIAVDHIGIQKAAGLESVLSESALDELAQAVRLQIADRLPVIQIPVKVQRTIDLPAVELGPVRIDAASLPLQASVSRVIGGAGHLWIAIRVTPGEFLKSVPRSPAGGTPRGVQ